MIRAALMSVLLSLAACAGMPPAREKAMCAAAERFVLPPEARNDAIAALPETERNQLALDMVACLEDRDPEVRDGFAYETYAAMMRGNMLDTGTLRALKGRLLEKLADAVGDPEGFRGPFAALVLSEVARTDRLEPWMDPDERSGLVAAAAVYMTRLADYRGFSDADGWRHGVAHSADIFTQLALNERLEKADADIMLAAIASKAGTSAHAYVFGEPARLAAPVYYLAGRDFYPAESWPAWLSGLWPDDGLLRENAYQSEAALRRLHNLTAFGEALYVTAKASGQADRAPLADASLDFLRSLP